MAVLPSSPITVCTPAPGDMHFTILVEEFVNIITMHSFFPTSAGVQKKIFEDLILFHYMGILAAS